MDGDWIIPNWPAPPRVRAICSTRHGGVSRAPYDSLNLGDHVGDAAAAVARNRSRYAQALDARPVFLQQVHGSAVVQLTPGIPDGTAADGCISTGAGLACTIMVADCLPVLLTDTYGAAVAAAHAGWRGLAGSEGAGILETVVQALRSAALTARASGVDDAGAAGVDDAAGAGETIAWLGPCIGPRAFEVGDEVMEAFVLLDRDAVGMFRPLSAGKWLADLQGLARLRLATLGVKRVYGNDGGDAWCTVSHPLRFFSHRRDRVSGRLAASVWLA